MRYMPEVILAAGYPARFGPGEFLHRPYGLWEGDSGENTGDPPSPAPDPPPEDEVPPPAPPLTAPPLVPENKDPVLENIQRELARTRKSLAKHKKALRAAQKRDTPGTADDEVPIDQIILLDEPEPPTGTRAAPVHPIDRFFMAIGGVKKHRG